jgi:hypothetical protein
MFFDWSCEAADMASSVPTIALIEITANEGASSRLWYTAVSRRKYDHGGILGRFATGGGDDE